MNDRFQIRFLESANRYIETLSKTEKANVIGDVYALKSGRPEAVRTKQLRGPIRELIVGHHRITYFKLESTLFFVRGFRKKTQKTPLKEIEYAEAIYRSLSMWKPIWKK